MESFYVTHHVRYCGALLDRRLFRWVLIHVKRQMLFRCVLQSDFLLRSTYGPIDAYIDVVLAFSAYYCVCIVQYVTCRLQFTRWYMSYS